MWVWSVWIVFVEEFMTHFLFPSTYIYNINRNVCTTVHIVADTGWCMNANRCVSRTTIRFNFKVCITWAPKNPKALPLQMNCVANGIYIVYTFVLQIMSNPIGIIYLIWPCQHIWIVDIRIPTQFSSDLWLTVMERANPLQLI